MGILEERYGVAVSGTYWDAGPFKLWAAQSPGVILFSPKQPMLAKSLTTGRYEAACSQYRVQADNTYKIVGGGAVFTVTTAIQFDQGQLETLKDQWRQLVAGSPDAPKDPVFVPLSTRKGTTQLALPVVAGVPSDLTKQANDAGSPGGTISYMVDLTAPGALEWGDAFRSGKSPVAQVMLQYEYLRYMPACSVDIKIDGKRVFNHFSAELKASYDGWLYGGSVDIQAQMESLYAEGAISMDFQGLDDLPPGMEKIKENVTQTVIDQGLKAMLNMLFQPKPDVKPAQAGNSGGLFGGANLALKWQHEEESIDLKMALKFGGFTWLTERADADLSMFAVLDDSYVTTVNTELQFPASVTVIGDPQVATTAVAWSSSEGQAPQSPVFGATGGTQSYIVTSREPDAVRINYQAKIDYSTPQWPIVTTSGSGSVKDGLGNILIKPSAWVGSTTIYLYVKDAVAKGIKLIDSQAGGEDYLVVNVTYTGPNVGPIKASTRLSLDTPVTFNYPTSPDGAPGKATFSCFGVIGGQFVHAPDAPIDLNESAVFVLVTDKSVQLVSANAVIGEADVVAQDLLARGDRVVVSGDAVTAETQRSTEKHKSTAAQPHVKGTLVGVEYDESGAALWIETNGSRKRVPLRTLDLASSFKEQEDVDVELDASGDADKIYVALPGGATR